MSRLLQDAYNYIIEHRMLLPEDRIVVGLSGGADSVCLLLVLNALKARLGIDEKGLVAVHINHMIRGAEAEADMAFAGKLCDRLGIEYVTYTKDIPAYARERDCTVEEAGRMYRYQCFEETAHLKKCTKIAVAHNKNDVAETVLFNIIRGTGIKGMSGIPAVRGWIVRPLLFATRMEIEEYLRECNEGYRVDSTNNSTAYDRNKIRHMILPAMCEINSSAVEHICRVAELAEESYTYIDKTVQERLDKLLGNADTDRIAISRNELLNEADPVRQQLIHEIIGRICGHKKDITGRHIKAVEELLGQQTGKQLELPYGLKVRVSYDRLIFDRTEAACQEYNIEITGEGSWALPSGATLETRILPVGDKDFISKKSYTKVVDYGKIKGNLCIRNAQEGDYIVIDEQGRRKKLNRVFIDNKVDRQDRGNWPVIAIGSEVVWAVGLRYNEAYRVDGNTSHIMCLEYQRKGDING